MAAKRKDGTKHDPSEATTKLSRLLETEVELEAMLKDAKREAKELVEAAQAAADDRVQEFELKLKGEDAELKGRIERQRDQAIASIQEGAQRETERLDGLDDAKITELAVHVIELLVGRTDSRGSP